VIRFQVLLRQQAKHPSCQADLLPPTAVQTIQHHSEHNIIAFLSLFLLRQILNCRKPARVRLYASLLHMPCINLIPKVQKSKPRNVSNNLNWSIYYTALQAEKPRKLEGILCLGARFTPRGGNHTHPLAFLKPHSQLPETQEQDVPAGGHGTFFASVWAS